MAVELYRGNPNGPVQVMPDGDGGVLSDVLEAGLATVRSAVRITWDGGRADVNARLRSLTATPG